MKAEVEKGVAFICRVMNRDKKLDKGLIARFKKCLITILCERFHNHWYPENPSKGQAYRCIRINRKQPVDDSLLKACKACGMDYSQVELPWEFTVWIDPSEVCCRLGENNYCFTVKDKDIIDEDEETKSDKAETEVDTSDYHSESRSDCSSCTSEERDCTSEKVSAKGGAMASSAKWGAMASAQTKYQGPKYYYMPNPANFGLWVPHVGYVMPVTGYQPPIYYMDVSSTKAPEAKPRNPNLVKRLTRRATRY